MKSIMQIDLMFGVIILWGTLYVYSRVILDIFKPGAVEEEVICFLSAVRTQLKLCDLITCVGHPDKLALLKVQEEILRQQQPPAWPETEV